MREAIREACIQAALDAYEDAKVQGLCAEGAWECAVSAMRRLDMNQVRSIRVKRVYDPPEEDDGFRVLVDRVWPRGIKKDAGAIDRWLKAVAPSAELRKWFNHGPAKWAEFKKRYFCELREHDEKLRGLLAEAGDQPITLIYSACDERHNNAVVLREYLTRLAPCTRR